MSKARTQKGVEAARAAATSAIDTKPAPQDEHPRFRSTRGRPVMLASLMGGHTVSITHEPEGTPLHPRFHRQAVMEGCLPVASFTEVQADDAALVSNAGRDRAAMLRGCIADMAHIATEDPNRERELFDNSGRPRPEVMADRLGFPISIAERDAAWQEYAGDEAGDEDSEE